MLSVIIVCALTCNNFVQLYISLFVCMCEYLHCVGAICEKWIFIYNAKMIIFISQMLTNNCVLYCVCVSVILLVIL